MRQLGGPLPEPPPVRTDPMVESEPFPPGTAEESAPPAEPHVDQLRVPLEPHEAQQPDPYPVEVHRIEHQPVDTAPPEASVPVSPIVVEPTGELPRETAAAAKSAPESVSPLPATDGFTSASAPAPSVTSAFPQKADAPPPPSPELPLVGRESQELRITEARPEPNLASGRWEELNEFSRPELRRGDSLNRDSRPPVPFSGWGHDTEYEPQRRSFLRIALPIIAVLIAVGAILWGGFLRDRLNQQDAQVSALKEQNRKLAESLVSVSSANEGATPGATSSANKKPSVAQPEALAPPSESSPAAKAPAPSSNNAPAIAKAGATTPNQTPLSGKSREGVSTPPPPFSIAKKDSRRSPDANYHPEIVPPYPTLSQPQNVASTPGIAAPTQQTYRQPSVANSSGSAAASSTTASAGAANSLSGVSQPARVSPSNPQVARAESSSGSYSAVPNGMYASALAQNIEAVESLQRQSRVPLREFHARDGAAAKVAPGLTVSIQSPDPGRGTYALVVNGGGTNYQLRGHVNSPLAFTDNASHRVYELVVLRIANGEAYGYVRPQQ